MRNFFILLLSFVLMASGARAQSTSSLAGRILDASDGSALPGAAIRLSGTAYSCRSDSDGYFSLNNVPPGEYNLIIFSPGYDALRLPGMRLESGREVKREFSLTMTGEEIEVRAEKRQAATIPAIIETVKTLPSVGNAISAQQIRALPDRNSGEALRRVTGATIQDNKFAIIRGLNDRYNAAMINGSILPSSEAERRAFSFDIIPGHLLDNIIIIKSATPDLPGDFSGGLIQLNTKDIPIAPFVNLSGGSSYNSLTTGRIYLSYTGGKTDFLAFDDGTRSRLPEGLSPDYKEFQRLNLNQQAAMGAELGARGWNIQRAAALPSGNFQVNAGTPFYLRAKDSATQRNQFGVIAAVDYSAGRSLSPVERNWYNQGPEGEKELAVKDSAAETRYNISGMGSLAYKLNSRHRFYTKNTVSLNATNQTVHRFGANMANGNYEDTYAYQWTENKFLYTRVGGESILPGAVVLDYGLGHSLLTKKIPFFRNLSYQAPIDGEGRNFQVALAPNVTDESAIYFTDLRENLNSGDVNIKLPLRLLLKTEDEKNFLKVGGSFQHKARAFSARVLGFRLANPVRPTPVDLLSYGMDSLFRKENFSKNGIVLGDITNATSAYSAEGELAAAYAMIDKHWLKNLRVVGGVRFESYRQSIHTALSATQPLDMESIVNDWLPSLNLTLKMSGRANLRMSGFRSIARPEFRELAKFSFYDFNTFSMVAGNPDLKRTSVWNADIRYEYYPAEGETISAGIFGKKFANSIEVSLPADLSLGQLRREYSNAPAASLYGVEVEFRKSLKSVFLSNFSALTDAFSRLTAFGNLSYMLSRVDVADPALAFVAKRPLQGQSPYVINAGMQYVSANERTTATIAYNRIGNRISIVGSKNFGDVFEKGRNVIDLQLSHSMIQRKLTIKAGISDLLSEDLIFFQNRRGEKMENYGKYDPSKTNVMYRYTMPVVYSMGLSYSPFH